MLSLLRIAFRNLLRARRRNLLSGGTMALGSAALVLGNGLSDGIAHQLTTNLVAVQSGHVQVVVRATDFVPQNSPFDAYSQERLPEVAALLRRIEAAGPALGLRRATPTLYGRGSALAGSRSSQVGVVGIVPELELELRAANPALQGRFLPEGDELAAYLAEPLARQLRVGVGDSFAVVIQTAAGALNTLDFNVCGTFRRGAPWHDTTLYVAWPAAQRLFDMPAAATQIKLLLADGSLASARRAQAALRPLIVRPAGLAPDLVVHVETFEQAGRFAFSIVQANAAALFVLAAFLFTAAAVGVVNAMLMSVRERTREIGTLRALGLRRALVVRLFVCEGLVLGSLAAGVGVLVGGAFVAHWSQVGLPMNTFTLTWMAGGDRLYPRLEVLSVLRAAGAIVALSTLAALYPAFSASRLEPREALQHV
jgi:ABC-type lipoprotein release transport system permease subunit